MELHSGQLRFSTEGDGDVIDLTEGVRDLRATLERLVPTQGDYEPGGQAPSVRPSAGHPRNTHAQTKAAIVGPSETVPVRDRPRQRTVVVQVIG